jgi:hypothetical protein
MSIDKRKYARVPEAQAATGWIPAGMYNDLLDACGALTRQMLALKEECKAKDELIQELKGND